MSRLIRCDRCGKEIKPVKVPRIKYGFLGEPYDISLHQELEGYGPTSKRFDLCYDCYKELKEWLGNKKVRATHEQINED